MPSPEELRAEVARLVGELQLAREALIRATTDEEEARLAQVGARWDQFLPRRVPPRLIYKALDKAGIPRAGGSHYSGPGYVPLIPVADHVLLLLFTAEDRLAWITAAEAALTRAGYGTLSYRDNGLLVGYTGRG